MEKYELALASYTDAIRIDPTQPQAHYGLGLAYLNTKLYESTISECSIAIRLFPRYADSYNMRSTAYHMIGDDNNAATDRQKAKSIQLSPSH
ncbi:tetratricopeptide repeat protein [Xanthobacter flavus]|uniref:tetratricopeptide repeat protein n=1 Tax=Xanthobacter flavus TaxID=281 RepID=UPI00372D2E6F